MNEEDKPFPPRDNKEDEDKEEQINPVTMHKGGEEVDEQAEAQRNTE